MLLCLLFLQLTVSYSRFNDSCNPNDANFVNEYCPFINNQYIVTFWDYQHSASHAKRLSSILGPEGKQWMHVLRLNPSTSFPTDFLVIQLFVLGSKEEHLLNLIKSHPQIRYVTLERKLQPQSRKQRTGHNRKLLANKKSMSVTDVLRASVLWDLNFTGIGIRIAIFDTGLSDKHSHFRNIKQRTNWTNEKTLEDELGHGTFVAGVIASQSKDCLGFAPDAEIHVFRVFTNKQVSYTSWFLDAFNYAIHSRVHVLNLSIGGPDFLDRPFVDKVLEMSANNIIVVSAIGNDGPIYGTLNNPADQMDVIGVGGIGPEDKIASFSSRGMTTWELPKGYGRTKPDVVAYGENIRGSNVNQGCKTLSGTSVASPVVAGAVVLLASVIPEHERARIVNPASMKQALVETAIQLENDANIFEQGMGKINLLGAYEFLKNFTPHATVIPNKLNLTDCPYTWPYCAQPIYYSMQPMILNLTILNSMSVVSYILDDPVWLPGDFHSHVLDLHFDYPSVIWPWSGYLAVSITVKADVPHEMIVDGKIRVTISTIQRETDNHEIQNRTLNATEASTEPETIATPTTTTTSTVEIPLIIKVIPTPHKNYRVLWDQFHNLRYPSGYFPRDNLEMRKDVLDWNGDHPHTNFRDIYNYLRELGYYLEILGADYTCFDASLYGTLLLVDLEDEYFPEEVTKLADDVFRKGLSLVVFGEWYHLDTMKKIKFFDENTQSWWTPQTGGANIPALNMLLMPYGIGFGDQVYAGEINVNGHSLKYASGTGIAKFPAGGYLFSSELVSEGSRSLSSPVPVMGWVEPRLSRRSFSEPSSPSPVASPPLNEDQNQTESQSVPSNSSEESTSGLNLPQTTLEQTPSGTLSSPLPLPSDSPLSSGRIFVFGDANCLDTSHREGEFCGWLLQAALKYVLEGALSEDFIQRGFLLNKPYVSNFLKFPERLEGNQLARYSNVLFPFAKPQCLKSSSSSSSFNRSTLTNQSQELDETTDTFYTNNPSLRFKMRFELGPYLFYLLLVACLLISLCVYISVRMRGGRHLSRLFRPTSPSSLPLYSTNNPSASSTNPATLLPSFAVRSRSAAVQITTQN